jgi:hypothetical protein
MQISGLTEASSFDGTGGNLPTPGEYVFEVTDKEVGQSKGGHTQLTLSLKVIQGAETQAFNDTNMKHFFTITEHAGSKGRIRCLLEACEVPFDGAGFDENLLVGKQFIGEVYQDDWEKDDVATGGKVKKTNTKIRKERTLAAGWSDSTSTAETETAAAPAPPPPPPPPPHGPAPAAKVPAQAAQPGPRAPLPKPGLRPAPLPAPRK